MTAPTRPVLLTGASGALGRELTRWLGQAGWPLRLTDRVPFPDALPGGCTFEVAELEDGPALLRLAEGCGTVLHFGGVSTEHPFEDVLGANIRGGYHVYEAARANAARVVFASSNHSIGFWERDQVLDAGSAQRPDGFYGLSKCYTELLGRLYWDKHGVENVNLRIGSCFPEPTDARMLATWLSYADLTRLVEAATLAPRTGHCIVWGASANARMMWWREDHRERIGWTPQDSADGRTGQLEGKRSDPVAERYQGGAYCAMGYTRQAPSPAALFGA